MTIFGCSFRVLFQNFKMTSKTVLRAHVEEYKKLRAKEEARAFFDFCQMLEKRCIHSAQNGLYEYCGKVPFVCFMSVSTVQSKIEAIFPDCAVYVFMRDNDEIVDRVIVRW
jgi:viroplasmin and RNaseH domain-containing protein